MRVQFDAIMHCDLWHCFALSLPPPASSLLFSQQYKQNYGAFKIPNLAESKKE
jgi:hypothetical protein